MTSVLRQLLSYPARVSLAGRGLPERIRSTTFALLGLTAAAGLGLVVILAQPGWPVLSTGPVPAPPQAGAVADAVSLSRGELGRAEGVVARLRSDPGGGKRARRGPAPHRQSGGRGEVGAATSTANGNLTVAPQGGSEPAPAPVPTGVRTPAPEPPAGSTTETEVPAAPAPAASSEEGGESSAGKPGRSTAVAGSSSPAPSSSGSSTPGHSAAARAHGAGPASGKAGSGPGKAAAAPGHSKGAPPPPAEPAPAPEASPSPAPPPGPAAHPGPNFASGQGPGNGKGRAYGHEK